MKLMVSYDCGLTYGEEGTGSLEELQARAQELRLDERRLRWVIESDDGREVAQACAIHRDILNLERGLTALSMREEAQ